MERTRTYAWEDPLSSAAEGAKMAGIDYLKAMESGNIPYPPILSTLDIRMATLEKGKVAFVFTPQEFHYNPIGAVHGGMITAILDSAMGCSVHSLLPEGKGYTTLELKVNFIKAITEKSGALTATGKIISQGSRTAVVEAQLTNAEGLVFAHAVSTCFIFLTTLFRDSSIN